MPRNAVRTSYQRVQRQRPRKGRRKAQEVTPFQIRPRSPLAQYLHQEADSGLTIHELVEQFQEYDCSYDWGEEPIGVTEQENVFQCVECGLTKRRLRPGRTK